MTDQKDGQGEAKRNAQELRRRQSEGAPFVNRPQRQQEMDGRCAIKQHRARHAVPDLDCDLHPRLGSVQRDDAERMVDQMQQDVSEKDQPGCQTQVANGDLSGNVGEQRPAPGFRRSHALTRPFAAFWQTPTPPAPVGRASSRLGEHAQRQKMASDALDVLHEACLAAGVGAARARQIVEHYIGDAAGSRRHHDHASDSSTASSMLWVIRSTVLLTGTRIIRY